MGHDEVEMQNRKQGETRERWFIQAFSLEAHSYTGTVQILI